MKQMERRWRKDGTEPVLNLPEHPIPKQDLKLAEPRRAESSLNAGAAKVPRKHSPLELDWVHTGGQFVGVD